MISKKMLAVFGAAAMAAGLVAAPAFAKKGCKKACKDNLAACIAAAKEANNCKGLKGAEKKTCKTAFNTAKKACKDEIKADVTACNAITDDSHSICDSPSAAFLD